MPARADTVELRDGRKIRGDSCRREGDEILCLRAGGTIGFPAGEVVAIHRSESPDAPRRIRPPRPVRGASTAASPDRAPLPGPLAPGSAGLPDDDALLAARIATLEGSLRGGPGEEALRREGALLHTLVGNRHFAAGRYDEAERSYRRARDHDPDLRAARINHATALIHLDRLDTAGAIARLLIAEDPDDPLALVLGGEIAFRENRLDEAIALWDRAARHGGVAGIEDRLEKAGRLRAAEVGFDRVADARFDLRYDGAEAAPEIADAILRHLDGVFDALVARLGHVPSRPIGVVLYPRTSFHEATESEDWVGGLFDGLVRIPVGGLDRVTPRMAGVLAHELTHAFLTTQTRNNAPRWIQEGYAQVMEGKRAGRSAGAIAAIRATGGREPDPEFTYLKSLSQMEFFLDHWSDAGLRNLLDHLGRGTDIDTSLRRVTGLGYEDFLRAWGDWLDR